METKYSPVRSQSLSQPFGIDMLSLLVLLFFIARNIMGPKPNSFLEICVIRGMTKWASRKSTSLCANELHGSTCESSTQRLCTSFPYKETSGW